MARIRVLIVDDAVVVRRLVSDVLGGDPELEVVGVAANGRIALQKIPQVNPDVITMDVEMPDMNGIEAVKALRVDYPRLPVIMFSTLTERGAAATLDALQAGASDYVTKPANVGSVALAQQRVREDLIPKIKSLARQGEVLPPASPRVARTPVAAAAPPLRRVTATGAPAVLAIGVSTGGPNALAELIPALPATFAVPVVVVQHMPPMFTRLLAERLHAQSALVVREASDGLALAPGTVTIAPGDYHMVVAREGHRAIVRLTQDPPENSCRPAVDPLFRSVVAAYGSRVLAVVLTGMGQDGLRGAELVHEAGGRVLVQDEATSVVWGMPGFVARAGLADRVLPLPELAAEIVRRVSGVSSLPP
ncbi:MAG TPA: chemotaxis response regulator protein-glutamate methylesterase, partial [Luteitalea sp.]|nr:chemotaxis response regulator protein-glutamate methylesterase [Luteitalea sp.]